MSVMTDLERLLAVEEIKQLKARYFYHFDHRDWARWRSEVWAEQASLEVAGLPDTPVVGADNIISWTQARVAAQKSVHHGHMPDIEILDPFNATGVWAMEDILHWPEDRPAPDGTVFIHGFGHYHETYLREPRGWRIKSTRLTRLRVERRALAPSPAPLS